MFRREIIREAKESEMSTKDNLFNPLIELYYALNQTMERVPVNIILTDNLNRTHCELRPEYKDKLITESNALNNDYNGRMVVPHSTDETISILINTEKMKQYTDDGSLTWVGTFSHELTHAIDYYQMARREALTYYDPLEESASYHMFQLWSEYHARKLGYRLLREFHEGVGNLGDKQQQIKYITETEWPFHQNNHYRDYHSGIDGNQQMYITMQLLGRYSVWCDLFPNTFNEKTLSTDFYHTPWMGHLFSFLRKHESLDIIYSVFDEFRSVLAENWSFVAEE